MITGPLVQIPSKETTRLLASLLTANDLNDFWRASLRMFQGCLPHHSCSLLLNISNYQPVKGRHFVVAQCRHANQPVNSLSISRTFLATHPRIKTYTFDDVVREDPDAMERRMEREKVFNGWDDFAHLAFWNAGHPEAVLSIRRSKEQGKFRTADREFLNFLHPILDAGLKRLRTLEQERSHRQSLEHFISGMPIPVMFLSMDRKLVFATPEAFNLCAVWNFGRAEARCFNTRRCFKVPNEIHEACMKLLMEWGSVSPLLTNPEETRSLRIQHPRAGSLTAQVTISRRDADTAVRPEFCITFYSGTNLDGAKAELRAPALQHLQRLTPSERRVALLVAEGHKNQAVAEKLVKSIRTVDFQLNSIYRKLQITNRSELTRLLL
jgi:DNA-binding CsgD family transcriptional regulator